MAVNWRAIVGLGDPRPRRRAGGLAVAAPTGGMGGLAFRPSAPPGPRLRWGKRRAAPKIGAAGPRDVAPQIWGLRKAGYESPAREALHLGRGRMAMAAIAATVAFSIVGLRLAQVTLWGGGETVVARPAPPEAARRGQVTDRSGALIATTLPTASLFADARRVLDVEETVAKLATVLPDLDRDLVRNRLNSRRAFVWLERDLSPQQHDRINRLGLPGLQFQTEERRVYPHGASLAHLLGFVNVDGAGLAGLERAMERPLAAGEDVTLSIDARAQFAVRAAVGEAMHAHQARAGVGIVMDVETAEIVAMVSAPEFDPHDPGGALADARFNRATLGVYEMGSTFKIFTTAMALEAGAVDLNGGYDATDPIEAYGHTIRDFHPRGRWLTVPEIFKYSSNIGSARMALDVGREAQQAWLARLGLTDAPEIELAEIGRPLIPDPWRPINTMTIAYGHGLSVSPLQITAAVGAVVNGGVWRAPTLLKRGEAPEGRRVFSEAVSADLRRLMRLSVVEGTGRRADAPGYFVGGKTGSAEKIVDGAYSKEALISSFIGAFPMDAPRYVVLAMLDEPKGNAETHGYATGGWVAAPIARRIVEAVAPMLGVAPRVAGDPRAVAALAIDPGGPPLEETIHAPQ